MALFGRSDYNLDDETERSKRDDAMAEYQQEEDERNWLRVNALDFENKRLKKERKQIKKFLKKEGLYKKYKRMYK